MKVSISHNYFTAEEYKITDESGESIGLLRHLPNSHWYMAQWVNPETGDAHTKYFPNRDAMAQFFGVSPEGIYAGI